MTMNDELTDAILDYVSTQCGAVLPSNVHGCMTGVSVTQEYTGGASLEVSMRLVESDRPRTSRVKSRWIEVKSRLPDIDEPVLVCLRDSVTVGACDENGVFVRLDSTAAFRPQPTHWQPMPPGVA